MTSSPPPPSSAAAEGSRVGVETLTTSTRPSSRRQEDSRCRSPPSNDCDDVWRDDHLRQTTVAAPSTSPSSLRLHVPRFIHTGFVVYVVSIIVVSGAYLVATVTAADDTTTNGGGGGGPESMAGNPFGKPCPNFHCTGGYEPTPKTSSVTQFESTGCATMNSGNINMAVADMGGTQQKQAYEPCCHVWHACYQVCGVSKKTCDDDFKTCTEQLCKNKGEECQRAATMSNLMTQLSGCQKFNQDQYQACECTPQQRVAKKREAAIRAFYTKFVVPDHASDAKNEEQKAFAQQLVDEKVTALVEKSASSAGKLAGLFRALMRKYPHAIKSVKPDPDQLPKNPQQEMLDKIMKEQHAKEKKKEEVEDDTGSEQQQDEEEEDKMEL